MPGKRVEFQSTVRVRDDSRSAEDGGAASELLVPLAGASPLRNRGPADGAASGTHGNHYQFRKQATDPAPVAAGYQSTPEQCVPLLPLHRCADSGSVTSGSSGYSAASKNNSSSGYSTLPSRFSPNTKLSLVQYAADDMYCSNGRDLSIDTGKVKKLGGRNRGGTTVSRSQCRVSGCLPLVQSKLDDVVEWQDWWKHRHHHQKLMPPPPTVHYGTPVHHHSHLHHPQQLHPHHQQHSTHLPPLQPTHTPPPPPPPPAYGRCAPPNRTQTRIDSNGVPAAINSARAALPGSGRLPVEPQEAAGPLSASPKPLPHNVTLSVESPFRWLCRAQAVSLICSIISLMLIFCSLSSSHWLTSEGWSQGVLLQCADDDALRPLPFDIDLHSGCQPARTTGYIIAVQVLSIGGSLLVAVGIVIVCLGLSSKNTAKACIYFRWSLIIATVTMSVNVVALFVYPLCFSLELNDSNRPVWEFGWAYGVAWGAAIFQFGAVMLLLTDRWTLRRKPPGQQSVT